MEYATIAGNYYTITSKTGCTVTDATGTLEETVEAGKQLSVQAPSDKLICNDEQAIIFKSNFNFALARRSAGGGATADGLPAGYTAIEYLESTGYQRIQTDWQPGTSTTRTIELDVCYLESSAIAPMMVSVIPAANSYPWITGFHSNNTATFSRSDRSYFARGKLTNTPTPATLINDKRVVVKLVNYDLYVDGVKQTMENYGGWSGSPVWATASGASVFRLQPNTSGTTPSGITRAQLYSLKFSNNNEVVYEFVPAINANGEPCLYDKLSGRAFTNVGTGRFIAGLSGLTALSNLLLKLPHRETAGSTLDVRLPDNVNQEEVTRLCDLAGTYKNWQIVSR